jgi:hypothetical protein
MIVECIHDVSEKVALLKAAIQRESCPKTVFFWQPDSETKDNQPPQTFPGKRRVPLIN